MTTWQAAIFIGFLGGIAAAYGAEAAILLRALARAARGREESGLWTRPAAAIHALAGIGLLCIAYGYLVEPRWMELSRIDVPTGGLESTSVRLVHISDLHCGREPLNGPKLPGLINPLNPDIIVFTGDCLDHPAALERFRRALSGLDAELGKFAVRGNVDRGPRMPSDLFKGTGFRELDGESVRLQAGGETLRVAGMASRREVTGSRLPEMSGDAFTVFLHHFPGAVEDVAGPKIDLYLSGHTHGGQVALPFYGALVTLAEHGKKYERGLYRVGSTTMYVNRGVGVENRLGPPVRFLARPEIAIFDIHPGQRSSGGQHDARKPARNP